MEHAVRLDPKNPEVWATSADVWLALGEPDRARVALIRATGLAPERQDLRTRLERVESELAVERKSPPG